MQLATRLLGGILWMPSALFLGVGCGRVADAAAGERGLEAYESKTVDFGTVFEGERPSHTFRLINRAAGRVAVATATPSCGCTVSDLFLVVGGRRSQYEMGSPIPPKALLDLVATLESSGKQGQLSNTITLTDGDGVAVAVLTIDAMVKPFIECKPRAVDFGTLATHQVASHDVRVTSEAFDSFQLSLRESSQLSGIEAELFPVEPREDGAASAWILHLTIGPGLPESSRFHESVLLVSDQLNMTPSSDGGFHKTRAFVQGRITGQTAVTPEYVSFGIVERSEPRSKSVMIESTVPNARLLAAEVGVTLRSARNNGLSSNELSWSIEEVDGASVRLVVTIAPEHIGAGAFRNVLVLRTSANDDSIEVPVFGMVKE